MAEETANAEPKKEQGTAAKQQPPQQPRHHPQHEQRREAKKATSIIRMGGADIDGSLNIERALSKIKGIGSNFSHSLSYTIETKLGISKSTALGDLSEEQVESINNIIKEPLKYGIPILIT
ncbi:MAG: 30S ribosomal protein S13, partial [Candidatus Marsarchaeota archaeon]|nr:30S ribosomal protein S13 [Candidatus Marsarchaeota archaeon]